jgi:hypothetical protein
MGGLKYLLNVSIKNKPIFLSLVVTNEKSPSKRTGNYSFYGVLKFVCVRGIVATLAVGNTEENGDFEKPSSDLPITINPIPDFG